MAKSPSEKSWRTSSNFRIDTKCYRIAGQDFTFPWPVPELAAYQQPLPSGLPSSWDAASGAASAIPDPVQLISRLTGWVASAQRQVEAWLAPPGILLKVAGGRDFYIGPGVRAILSAGPSPSGAGLDEMEREILLGPALVLALALRGRWCLHASALLCHNNLVLFLGESGRG